LRNAVLGQVLELEAIVSLLNNITDDEKNRLRFLIRSLVFATVGVSFLSTVTGRTHTVDFNQFAEPFRRALLRDGVPTWNEMCHQILELVNERGY
jgi:hypothetical protein